MRYKAEYAPSDLLCSRAGVWVPYERVASALRADPGCILSQVLPRRGSPSCPCMCARLCRALPWS